MKVLWCTPTSSLYSNGINHHYHGGGWIESLEELITNDETIDLAITFLHNTDSLKIKQYKTTYYPIKIESRKKNIFKYIGDVLFNRDKNERYIKRLLQVIDDFKPDVIHVFGTETIFASIQSRTDIPIAIHLQGLINPYHNSFYPSGVSNLDFIFSRFYFFENLKFRGPIFTYKNLKKQAVIESHNLKISKFLMGRTEWDKVIGEFYNPAVSYFNINEVLRPLFYKSYIKVKNVNQKITIISTISSTIYKGIDMILKTANLLTKEAKVDFIWKLVGLNDDDKLLNFFEKKLKLSHLNLNIQCVGIKKPEELVRILNIADLFVHPSYIDNSPNSICEAQILGLPVIACNVGGISSLLKNNETGILIPSNGIFELAHHINSFHTRRENFEKIAEQAMRVAKLRHNKNVISQDILSAYLKMLNKN